MQRRMSKGERERGRGRGTQRKNRRENEREGVGGREGKRIAERKERERA